MERYHASPFQALECLLHLLLHQLLLLLALQEGLSLRFIARPKLPCEALEYVRDLPLHIFKGLGKLRCIF